MNKEDTTRRTPLPSMALQRILEAKRNGFHYTDYELFYDYVAQEQERILEKDIREDYRLCKAYAACCELKDYLSDRIAELIDLGYVIDV